MTSGVVMVRGALTKRGPRAVFHYSPRVWQHFRKKECGFGEVVYFLVKDMGRENRIYFG